ncbi:MAG: hydantoinase B/oxoprolinase family protein [Myxococcales bacterium]|nr:hydantoinase B/oxoprolinase family protein [Myxococcales bacterium]MBK7191511.1 hydantoinase B/oxoprolinase family protein [Myxococcales bacterium]MBP6843140.1 hydantoinase B/oxoprolinase family protein [Kofleriaceae bacterium]
MSAPAPAWAVWIDRGGTFTDAIAAHAATGELRTAKVPSQGDAIVAAVRAVLGPTPPPHALRLGTTVATNALLERRGAPTALAITRGFGDLLAIGDQTRPALFALDIVRPTPLPTAVLEVEARADPAGATLAVDDPATLAPRLAALVAAGCTSLAVVVMHGHAAPALEDAIAAAARAAGFAHVTCSHEVAATPGLLARAETAVIDAYLTPIVAAELAALAAALPMATIEVMTSSGELVAAADARGRALVLSGPAGGVIATRALARRGGLGPCIAFDMGGTSTDVAAVVDEPAAVTDVAVAGLRLRTPALDIHTIAAGGGSIARWDGLALTVGPDSAGARPGPICYGHGGAAITITDVDLALGRLPGAHFPWPLDRAAAHAALATLGGALAPTVDDPATHAAAGLFAIATAQMAEAVRTVSIGRGLDARGFTLVGFGGAAGMHVGPVARALGIRHVVVPRHASLLSAWGIGHADRAWRAEVDGAGAPLTDVALAALADALDGHGAAGAAALPDADRVTRAVAVRVAGTDTAIEVPLADAATVAARFDDAHRARFGFAHRGALELVRGSERRARAAATVAPPRGDLAPPAPPARTRLWSDGAWHDAPVLALPLAPGAHVDGPALLLDPHTTIVVDVGWRARVAAGDVHLDDHAGATHPAARAAPPAPPAHPDPVLLEVYGHRFMAIATQMGAALERTATSVNIRERRDFSCALFDASGDLIANAPHVPVHLGAMGETVRALLAAHPAPPPGTSYACNDPAAGGSHLPDVTVITPVHDAAGALAFIVANRGHHADVGGLTPGSMPPHARALADEGVVLRHLPVVVAGELATDAIRAALAAGPYPARVPADNLADLAAQLAANQLGARLVTEAIAASPPGELLAYFGHVQDHAHALAVRALAALPPGVRRFDDALDDGSPIVVAATVAPTRLRLDFTGSAAAHPGNLNAPRAVTVAAALYVVRALVDAAIPLNAGFLRALELIIPPGSILDPPPGAAVSAGNVETSQRIVDVLLGALGLAAASQGTMNNLTLGGPAWAYYETIAGGAGATPRAPGASAVHTHMTNTRITDPEILERRVPVRLARFAIRRGSGGAGARPGGDGVIRELVLLAPAEIALIAQRHARAPFGLAGGEPGQPGRASLDGVPLGGAAHVRAAAGAVLRIETPGGGGHGARSSST